MYQNKSLNKIKSINKAFNKIKDPNDLYHRLLSLFDKRTCSPRLREKWNKNNVTLGQCAITSFLVQDIFGGEVYGICLADGGIHCFNVINDILFDLTSEQFNKEKLDYSNCKIQSRDVHFKKKEKYERYLLLRKRLLDSLK